MGRREDLRMQLWSLQQGLALGLLAFLAVSPLAAQSSSPPPNDQLALRQGELADRYARLEKLMLRMAEFDAADNPRRAELLRKAFATSQDRDVQRQLEQLVELLQQDKLSRAIVDQGQVAKDMQAILELLLKENRADRLKDEQQRVKAYIREIERLERMQRGVQGRTEGGVAEQKLTTEQERVAERTSDLGRQMTEDAGPSDEDPSSEDGAGDVAEGRPDGSSDESPSPPAASQQEKAEAAKESREAAEENPTEGQPAGAADRPAAANDSPPSTAEAGEAAEGQPPSDPSPAEGTPSPGAPSPGGPSPGAPSGESSGDAAPPPTPGQAEVQQAEAQMRRAEQKLAEAKRDAAIEAQEEAVRLLAKAKAELEELLRQKREEEIERVLALLEARFRRMLQMELQVYESTLRLSKIPPERRDRFVDIEAGKLSFQQRRIVVEADKCLALLKEEGSSVAFPESVEQIRGDMEQVELRLSRAQIGRLTQGIEEDIIEALDEMIEALQQAQMEQEQRKQQPVNGEGPPSDEQALVDKIAELRMLKAMQLRINKRTDAYSRLLDDDQDRVGQANDADLLEALSELSDRETRLQEITRDIVVGKNQ